MGRDREKQRIQACMVAVHAALCGLLYIYTCTKRDSYHARKRERQQETAREEHTNHAMQCLIQDCGAKTYHSAPTATG
jgi:hypothetical protein